MLLTSTAMRWGKTPVVCPPETKLTTPIRSMTMLASTTISSPTFSPSPLPAAPGETLPHSAPLSGLAPEEGDQLPRSPGETTPPASRPTPRASRPTPPASSPSSQDGVGTHEATAGEEESPHFSGEADRPLAVVEASSDPFDEFDDDDFDDEFDDDFEEDWDDEEEEDGFGPEFQDSEGEEFDVNADVKEGDLDDDEDEADDSKSSGSRFSGDDDFDE
ncbi:hypothetical protein [Botrimarina hoheduenensis]|uniref:Uncharacterized protein n=1 Tax=Botrimarina hoheduenensis TaxID=2528000 RepID=A0A5C5WD64_9BACT|nr:hypothetical protein [Botrimarina hoheduenensis]TWT48620.1 hypothetical protein Pla111_03950 [Botrimarina hoheduenensis]